MANIIFSEASGLNDSVFGKSQAPIKAYIADQVEAFEKESLVDKIFVMEQSKNYAEKFTSETSLDDFEDVGENGAYPLTNMQEGFSKVIEPTTWKSRFEVTQEMMEDAKMGKVKKKAGMFSLSYGRTRENYAAKLIAGGLGQTVQIGAKFYDTTSADGVPLFSTQHPSATQKSKYTQSNLFKNAFSVAAMDAMACAMQDFCDDDGNVLAINPDTIIIPNDPVLIRAVNAAIDSDLYPESDSNATNYQKGLWRVLIWRYLPKTLNGKPYFMMLDSKFNATAQCLPWVDRVPLTVRSDIDPNTDANVFKGRARFAAGFNNWRSIAICGEGFAEGTDLAAQ